MEKKIRSLSAAIARIYGIDIAAATAMAGSVHVKIYEEFGMNACAIRMLPDEAPELYSTRQIQSGMKKRENPVQFFERVWRPYVTSGILYQIDLRRLDPKLVPYIHNYCFKKKIPPTNHLPPAGSEKTQKLAAIGEPYATKLVNESAKRRESRPLAPMRRKKLKTLSSS